MLERSLMKIVVAGFQKNIEVAGTTSLATSLMLGNVCELVQLSCTANVAQFHHDDCGKCCGLALSLHVLRQCFGDRPRPASLGDSSSKDFGSASNSNIQCFSEFLSKALQSLKRLIRENNAEILRSMFLAPAIHRRSIDTMLCKRL